MTAEQFSPWCSILMWPNSKTMAIILKIVPNNVNFKTYLFLVQE